MSIETDWLRKLDMFRTLSPALLEEVAGACTAREFSAGDVIVKQGEAAVGLLFVRSGRVQGEMERNGARTLVAEYKAGDVLGDLSVVSSPAALICREETRCLLLTRDRWSMLMDEHPGIAVETADSRPGGLADGNREAELSVPDAGEKHPEDENSSITRARPAIARRGSPLGKTRIREFLVDVFSRVYTVKAITRFSLALIGCPVRVRAEAPCLGTSIGGVRLLVFPAAHGQVLRIDAYGDGEFDATVFLPAGAGSSKEVSIRHFSGRVRRKETIRLHVPGEGDAWLECARDAGFRTERGCRGQS